MLFRSAAVNTAAGGGGGGSGAYAITVTVTDGTNPLQNALVAISEGVTRHALSTDASGNADFSLNAATYDVTITKDGYDFTPTTRTVTGEQAGTLTDDLVMTQVAITASSDPLYCTVYGTFKHPDGTAGDGIVITATLYATGATTNAGGQGVVLDEVSITLNASGAIPDSTNLVRTDQVTRSGCRWSFDCDDLRLHASGIELTSASFNLTTLLDG